MRSIVETLQPEVPYRVRQLLGPGLTAIGRVIGQPEYELRDTEYVGTVRRPLDEFTERLRDHGFEWDPLAWYHQPPVGSEPNGSWTYRRTPLGDRQVHVILIAHAPGYVDVFAHEEYNWLRHPIKHLRQVGIEREAGSSEVKRWIERQDVGVTAKSRRRRQVALAVTDLREFLGSVFG